VLFVEIKEILWTTRARCYFVKSPHLRSACHVLLTLNASQTLNLREDLLCPQPVDTTELLSSSCHRIDSGDSTIAFTFGVRDFTLIFRTHATVPSATSASLEPAHDRAKYMVF